MRTAESVVLTDWPPGPEERRVFDLLAKGFGPGSDAQLALVLTGVQRDDVVPIERIVDALEADPGIARLSPPLLGRDRTTAVVAIAAAGNNLYQLHRDGAIWQHTGMPCSGVRS